MASAQVAEVESADTVVGWRLFALEGGRLLSSEGDLWSPGMNHVECEATENLFYLLEAAPVDGGVLARVKLSGVLTPAVGVPETMWRASQAEVLEVHLAAQHEAAAEALRAAYDVPVAVYEAAEWPDDVKAIDPHGARRVVSETAFRTALAELTFGKAGKLSGCPDTIVGPLVKTAHDAVSSLASGVGTRDLARALWDSALMPTIPEAEAFIEAVVDHLWPWDPGAVPRTQVFTRPPSLSQTISRDVALTVARAGL